MRWAGTGLMMLYSGWSIQVGQFNIPNPVGAGLGMLNGKKSPVLVSDLIDNRVYWVFWHTRMQEGNVWRLTHHAC